jgi:hypothetical protein
MKAVLIMILAAISFSASAQWYRIDLKLKKKQERPPVIERVTDHSIARLPHVQQPGHPKIYPVKFSQGDYRYEAAEAIIMKQAQHNMRFRIYNDASYNFTDLAHLFAQQNRFSEAKWYLLQSNLISRQQNDDKHTIANLIDLATIKIIIGEFILAQTDLEEARDLASSRDFKDNLAEIENIMQYIKQNRLPSSIPLLHYAETPQNDIKAE